MTTSCYGILTVQEELKTPSYRVAAPCNSYVSTLQNGELVNLGIKAQTVQEVKKLAKKNLYKDVKNTVCAFSNVTEASKVRKRLIATQKVYGTISNKDFNFASCDDPIVPVVTVKVRQYYLKTIDEFEIKTISGFTLYAN